MMHLMSPTHFSQNCASSRPSSSVTNSGCASFTPGISSSQDEESTITNTGSTMPALEKEEERVDGKMSGLFHALYVSFALHVPSLCVSWSATSSIPN